MFIGIADRTLDMVSLVADMDNGNGYFYSRYGYGYFDSRYGPGYFDSRYGQWTR